MYIHTSTYTRMKMGKASELFSRRVRFRQNSGASGIEGDLGFLCRSWLEHEGHGAIRKPNCFVNSKPRTHNPKSETPETEVGHPKPCLKPYHTQDLNDCPVTPLGYSCNIRPRFLGGVLQAKRHQTPCLKVQGIEILILTVALAWPYSYLRCK